MEFNSKIDLIHEMNNKLFDKLSKQVHENIALKSEISEQILFLRNNTKNTQEQKLTLTILENELEIINNELGKKLSIDLFSYSDKNIELSKSLYFDSKLYYHKNKKIE